MDKGAAKPCFTLGEQLPDKIIFHIQVLVKELAQQLLVNVSRTRINENSKNPAMGGGRQ